MTRIAVVEDEPITRRLVERALGHAGYTVHTYTHGHVALEALELSAPDLLITDLGLPDISGYELIARVRAQHGYPIMILSGRESEQDFDQGFAAGADEYLRKPIAPAELAAKCRRLIDREARGAQPGAQGPRFEHHTVEDWLASGGYGDVYRVRDRAGRVLALKHLRGPLAKSQESRLRFLREAYTLAAFRHPHVAELQEIGGDPAELYYTMDFVPGPTLTAAALSATATSSGQLIGLLRPLADVLVELERRGLVHRDLKPSNIVLRDGDWSQPMLLDFGLAKHALDRSLTLNEEVLGTPGFLPPESLLDAQVDVRGDVFSLGVVALFALTGHPPFPGQNGFSVALRMQHERVPLPAGLPAELASLLGSMTAIDPADRPGPVEVCERLDALSAAGDRPLQLPWLQPAPGDTQPTRSTPRSA